MLRFVNQATPAVHDVNIQNLDLCRLEGMLKLGSKDMELARSNQNKGLSLFDVPWVPVWEGIWSFKQQDNVDP